MVDRPGPRFPEGQPGDAAELPFLDSTPAPERPLTSTDADFSAPPLNPEQRALIESDPALAEELGLLDRVQWDRPEGLGVVVDDLTTPDRIVRRNADGSFTAELTTTPVRYRGDDGEWAAVDLDLEAGAGGVAPKGSGAPFVLTSDGAVDVPVGGGTLQISPPSFETGSTPTEMATTSTTPASVPPPGADRWAVDGASAAAAVADDVAVRVLATATGFEQLLDVGSPSGPSSYQMIWELPRGVSLRAGGVGIELVDGGGRLLGSFGSGLAWDAAGAEAPAAVSIVEQSAGRAVVAVGVDPAWFASSDRVFPVTIDPTYASDSGSGGGSDTWVRDGLSSMWSHAELRTGKHYIYPGYRQRSFLKFDLPTVGENVWVQDAYVSVRNFEARNCNSHPVELRGLDAAFDSSTVWSNMPAVDSHGIVSTTDFSYGYTGCSTAWADLDATALVQRWLSGTQDNDGLELRGANETSDLAAHKKLSSGDSTDEPTLNITYNHYVDPPVLDAPAADGVVASTEPTFSVDPVTDPDGDTVKYWFRVWTDVGTEELGMQVNSGWSTSTSWTPPPGSLTDGVSYSWRAYAWDGVFPYASASDPQDFSVNVLAGSGMAPSDSMGPVSVDLRTGAATVGVSGPVMQTLGGGIGVSATYNSKTPAAHGLTGSYYRDADDDQVFDTGELMGSRTDPMIAFEWSETVEDPPAAPPYPGITDSTNESYLVRWEGTIEVPSGGPIDDLYQFGAVSSRGVRVSIGGVEVLDRWNETPDIFNYYWGDSVELEAGVEYPITVEFNKNGPYSRVYLDLRENGEEDTQQTIPSDWLTPKVQPDTAVPFGWELSIPAAAGAIFDRAEVVNDAVTFVGAGGSSMRFVRNGDAWEPPDGDTTSTLSIDGDGLLTLNTGGIISLFNANGTLSKVVSDSDDPASTSATYTWSTIEIGANDVNAVRLTQIADPVSGRSVSVSYEGQAGVTCPELDDPVPDGMICQVDYWDGSETQFGYTSGLLSGVLNPGSELTRFGYSSGLLTDITDPLASDAIAASVRSDTAATRTIIAYSSGKVSSVTLPEPTPSAARPAHSYTYSSTGADVSVAGLTQPLGYWRRVAFDSKGRHTTDTDATGLSATQVWDAEKDQVLYVDDPTGLRTSTIVDTRGFPTETWGPAASSLFNGAVPDTGNSSVIPHVVTGYDENMPGLAATWWETGDLNGTPDGHSLAVGHLDGGIEDGDITVDWGPGAPSGVSATNNWSGRLTGAVDFTVTGTYELRTVREGKVRVYLDSELVIDEWVDADATSAATSITVTAGDRRAIMIEYADPGGDASLTLQWKPPSGSWVTIPGENLEPNYFYQTSSTDPDGLVIGTTYDLDRGIADTTVIDPGGLDLATEIGIEPVGSGAYGRRTSRTLPAGNEWTYAYYTNSSGGDHLKDNPCTSGTTESIEQGGQLKSRTGPTPAAGSAITEELIYDAAGRVLAARYGTESWRCTTYDARGRVIEQTVPAFGGASARTITYDYDVSANPLVGSASDAVGTITTEIDLLGRPLEVTDVWGVTETTVYDQAGRTLSVDNAAGEQTWTYDAAGRVLTQSLDGDLMADVDFDAYGRVEGIDYPSGTGNIGNGTSLDVVGYDALGRLDELVWKDSSAATLASDAVTRSLAGRVEDQTIDGTDPNTGGENFAYDDAGRLVTAYVPGSLFTYEFDPDEACTGGSATAGANTNRTKMIKTPTGGSAATTTYCYDEADRLISTTQANMGTLTYDAHGNLTTLGSETHTYDGTNRHLSTYRTGIKTVEYERDATDRIVKRSVDSSVIARYTLGAAITSGGGIIETYVSLPGGVTVTNTPGTNRRFQYPNIHGDIVAEAGGTGGKVGTNRSYDPYGVINGDYPTNGKGNFDRAWMGVQPTEHESQLHDSIAMGARQYSPKLGRFLGVDPIEGGSANDYEYALGDSINNSDVSGKAACTDYEITLTAHAAGLERWDVSYNYTCQSHLSWEWRTLSAARWWNDRCMYVPGKTPPFLLQVLAPCTVQKAVIERTNKYVLRHRVRPTVFAIYINERRSLHRWYVGFPWGGELRGFYTTNSQFEGCIFIHSFDLGYGPIRYGGNCTSRIWMH